MPHVSSLDRHCWNYQVPTNGSLTLPLAKELLTYHVHLAVVEDLDVFSVATIRGVSSGLWELIDTVARANRQSATKLLFDTKLSLRAGFKVQVAEGLLVSIEQRCSPRRIEATFNHVMFNQGVRIYDQERDGFPQF